MNINIFFVIVSISLSLIYFLFEPLNVKEQKLTNIPLFELSDFTLYEFNNKGLTTLMSGENSKNYGDKYVVENIDYTDNTKEFIANMKAKDGLYQDDLVDLKGDVVYSREDNLIFETQTVHYDKKSNMITTNAAFVMFRENDKVIGSSLKYNTLLDKAEITDVVVTYQLEEQTK